MTKKKFLAALSTAAITTSLLATTAFAATTPEWNNNGGQATGEGGGEVRVPVIEVEVPLELPFAVNPYKLNLAEEGDAITDQIWSDNYMIINHSEVPVAVKTESYATVGSDVTLESAVATDTKSKKFIGADATKKGVMLGMQFATDIALANDAYTIDYGDKLRFDAETPATGETAITNEASLQAKNGLLLGSGDTNKEEATFVLGTEAVEADVAKGVNAAAFKYVGAVNDSTTEVYADEDLKVTTVYTLSVLAGDDVTVTTNKISAVKGYEAAATGDNAQGALNVWKKS